MPLVPTLTLRNSRVDLPLPVQTKAGVWIFDI